MLSTIETVELIIELEKERKAYLNAYDITNDESMLQIAHSIQDDIVNLEIESKLIRLDLQYFATIKGDIKTMNNTNLFKNAHIITKAMHNQNIKEGYSSNYQACFKLALIIIKDNRLYEIDTLVPLNKLEKDITTTNKEINKVPNKKVENKKPAKQPKQAKQAIIEDVAKIGIFTLPINIYTTFDYKIGNTIQSLIEKSVHYANKKNGKHLENEKMIISDGLEKLEKVQSFNELQAIMLTYFLTTISKYMINKMLDFGASYKKLENRDIATLENAYSYSNASSNNGKITLFEVEDIYNELIVQSYSKVFDKKMFDNINFVNPSLFFRISNILRTEIRRNKKHFNISLENNYKLIEENEGLAYEYNISLLDSIDFLNKDEKTLLEYRIKGYSKKEIDILYGQRMDRKQKTLENKLEEKAGKTLKQAKIEKENEILTLKEKLQAMKEKQKEIVIPIKQAEQFKATSYKLGNTIQLKEKTLPNPNFELVEKKNRLMNEFNSKAILAIM